MRMARLQSVFAAQRDTGYVRDALTHLNPNIAIEAIQIKKPPDAPATRSGSGRGEDGEIRQCNIRGRRSAHVTNQVCRRIMMARSALAGRSASDAGDWQI
jgi:hypothetical protein